MKVILLGSGGYFPNGRRHTACLLLPEVGVVLDAGSGMCRLGEYRQTDGLEIYLTHAHLDHIAGLTYLINVVPPDVLRQTTVHGEPAKLAAVREHLFAELIFPVAPPFRFAPLRDGPMPLPGGGTIDHFPLPHPGGSVGFRLDWPGRGGAPASSLAYVTDTVADPRADYVQRIRGVDLLVHEAYFPDDRDDLPARTGHSSLPLVAEVAAAADAGRLVLVHIGPQLDERQFDVNTARRTFKNLEIGFDGMEL